MIDPVVYQQAYGISALEVLPSFAPAYQMRSLLGQTLLSTSPFLTDTVGLPTDPRDIGRYIDAFQNLVSERKATYGLIKTRDPGWNDAFRSHGLLVSDRFVTSVLDVTPGLSSLWNKTLHRKRRAQVERGRQVGARFVFGREDLLADFYRVFIETQTRLGTPVHSRSFFENILAHDPLARLVVGYVDGATPVTTAMLLEQCGTLFHPYTGTLSRYFPTYLNATLYWEIISHAVARGLERFDLGRSFKDSGVHQFKKYWGPQDIPLYYAYAFGPNASRKLPSLETPWLKLATQAWSHLPVPIAQRLGPHLIRSVP